jgi:hypothetical protein
LHKQGEKKGGKKAKKKAEKKAKKKDKKEEGQASAEEVTEERQEEGQEERRNDAQPLDPPPPAGLKHAVLLKPRAQPPLMYTPFHLCGVQLHAALFCRGSPGAQRACTGMGMCVVCLGVCCSASSTWNSGRTSAREFMTINCNWQLTIQINLAPGPRRVVRCSTTHATWPPHTTHTHPTGPRTPTP